jgi:hypothetical protein
MASTIAFACSRALSRIDFKKIIEWLNKTIREETDEYQFLYQRRSIENENRFKHFNVIVVKLANEIEEGMIDVKKDNEDILTEEDEEGMQLTYDSILNYMKTKKPEWSTNVQYIYDTLIKDKRIIVNDPIVVKALFDLAWNNRVIIVEHENEFDEIRVRNYIDKTFEDCGVVKYNEDGKEKFRYHFTEGSTRRPTHITLAQRFHNMDIPKGTSVFFYDENGIVHGKVVETNYKKLNPITRDTIRLDTPLEVDIKPYKNVNGKLIKTKDKIKQRTEVDLYFLHDAPARATKKLWSTSSAKSLSRSRSPQKIAMNFNPEYPLYSFAEKAAKPAREELDYSPLYHSKPMKRRGRSESRSSSRERIRRRSSREEERRSRSRSRSRDNRGGRKSRKTHK